MAILVLAWVAIGGPSFLALINIITAITHLPELNSGSYYLLYKFNFKGQIKDLKKMLVIFSFITNLVILAIYFFIYDI